MRKNYFRTIANILLVVSIPLLFVNFAFTESTIPDAIGGYMFIETKWSIANIYKMAFRSFTFDTVLCIFGILGYIATFVFSILYDVIELKRPINLAINCFLIQFIVLICMHFGEVGTNYFVYSLLLLAFFILLFVTNFIAFFIQPKFKEEEPATL